MDKSGLKDLISYLLTEVGETSKVKLAKLILFADILHFNRTGDPITGLYYVRLKNGPVVAFFDEVLEQNKGALWNVVTREIPIYSEGAMKKQYLYNVLIKKQPPKEINETIEKLIRKYGKKSGTELSNESHSLPAWKYSEPNEPIFIAELAVRDEKEYFTLVDLLEDSDDNDLDLAKKIPSPIPPG